MEYRACINGYDIKAHYSEKNIEEIFIPLLQRLTKLQHLPEQVKAHCLIS